jgi:hypothetical protein
MDEADVDSIARSYVLNETEDSDIITDGTLPALITFSCEGDEMFPCLRRTFEPLITTVHTCTLQILLAQITPVRHAPVHIQLIRSVLFINDTFCNAIFKY